MEQTTSIRRGPELLIPIDHLLESEDNQRKTFNEAALEELAASIRNFGVLQPLLVQSIGGKVFKIIAGARRYRAAKRAGLVAVPAIEVKPEDQQQASELALVENLQREDLAPLDEAEGFKVFLDAGGTIEELAERIGKPVGYIAKRRRLAELISKAKTLLVAGHLPLTHAIEIAKYTPAQQEDILGQTVFENSTWNEKTRKRESDGTYRVDSLSELKKTIQEIVFFKLSAAPWNMDDVDLVPAAGACSACSKRTGANLALFDDGADQCLDRKCYDGKLASHITRLEAQAKATGGELVRISHQYHADKGVLGTSLYAKLPGGKKPECEFETSAVFVDGDQAGHIARICSSRACPKHASKHGSGRLVTPKGFAETWEMREVNLRLKIKEQTYFEIWSLLRAAAPKGPDLIQKLGERLIDRTEYDQAKRLITAYGIKKDDGSSDPRAALKQRLRSIEGHRERELFVYSIVLAPLLIFARYGAHETEEMKAAGIDLKQVEKRVAEPLRAAFLAEKKKAAAREKARAKEAAAAARPEKPKRAAKPTAKKKGRKAAK